MSGDQVAVEPGVSPRPIVLCCTLLTYDTQLDYPGHDVVVWGGHGGKFHWAIDQARTGHSDGINKNNLFVLDYFFAHSY